MTTKEILNSYIDALELIKETEKELSRLRLKQNEILQDSVTGSNHAFPYEPKKFVIQGQDNPIKTDASIRFEENILNERKAKAEEIRVKAQECINTLPLRMQRIVNYRIFNQMEWSEVAEKLGRKATAESVRKEFQRFFEKK